jgi:hypothetical protein
MGSPLPPCRYGRSEDDLVGVDCTIRPLSGQIHLCSSIFSAKRPVMVSSTMESAAAR